MFSPIILVVVFSLFIPIYYTGKKYEYEWRKKVIYAEIKAAYEIHVKIENGLRGYGGRVHNPRKDWKKFTRKQKEGREIRVRAGKGLRGNRRKSSKSA